ERRESGAKQRRSIRRRQIVRDMHEPGGLCDHHLGISAIRINARVSLVTAVHEIAISAEFAITARASEEADTHALTNRPALDAKPKGIDPPDHFVPRDARPVNWKGGFHRAGIRVADTARLNADAYLTGARIDQRFHYGCEFPRFRYFDCFIRRAHISSFTFHSMGWNRIRNLIAGQGLPFETLCVESCLTAVVVVTGGLAVGRGVFERDRRDPERLQECRCRVAEHLVGVSAAG